MTVKEYVTSNNIKEFCCVSDHTVCLVYGKKQKPTTHHPINFCRLVVWEQYASYKRFGDREVVKVDGSVEPIIYTKWTLDELLKEYKELTHHKYLMPVWYKNNVTDEIEFEQEEIPH